MDEGVRQRDCITADGLDSDPGGLEKEMSMTTSDTGGSGDLAWQGV